MKSAAIKAVTFFHARQNLKAVMDTAINDSISVVARKLVTIANAVLRPEKATENALLKLS